MEASTLLIVDDDADLREVIASIFKPLGLTILEASGAEEAFQKLLEHEKIDVVISDLKMRNGGGFELLTKIKTSSLMPQKPAVILISGYPTVSLAQAKQLGASDLLAKPFDRKAIKHSVSSCLISIGRPGLPE